MHELNITAADIDIDCPSCDHIIKQSQFDAMQVKLFEVGLFHCPACCANVTPSDRGKQYAIFELLTIMH